MGITSSQGNILEEVKESFNQIVRAFDQEIFLIQENQVNTRQYPSREHITNIKFEEVNRLSNSSRSHSLDRYELENNVPIKHSNRSTANRMWQCQLCHATNQIDHQICFECGSSKVNVYVPFMEANNRARIRNTDQHLLKMTSSLPITRNPTDDNRQYRRSVLISHKRQADEQIVLQHVEKLAHHCLISQSRFKDETFPASSQSLYINSVSFSKSTLVLLPEQQLIQSNQSNNTNNQIQWLRPDKIVPKEWNDNDRTPWAIFRDPRPNDVLQGSLGDCWFITALSVLAEVPEYLMRVLITKQYNTEGIYCVRLCKDGEWTQVLVDDRLPCTPSKRLAYSQAHRKQLWVPLIEKALAKLNGSYEAIIAGRCCEGLATVTGSPCETLILGRENNPDDKNVDYERLWWKLMSARSKRFLMCAMCSNNLVDKEEFDKCGLLNIHAYSLQDVRQSQDGKHRLVKLRNPWGGAFRWTGDWSDNSRLWLESEDLYRELYNVERNKRDGVFWMPFTAFVKYFECVDICKIRHNWYEVRDSANFYPSLKKMQAYYLKISHPTELDIALHRRISKNLRIKRSDVSLCVAIVNIEENSIGNNRIYAMPIVSQRGQHKFISADGNLSVGTYVILPFLFNPLNKQLDTTEFNIVIHSSHPVDLERIRIPTRIEREFLIKLCIFHGDPVRITNNQEDDTNPLSGVTIYELKRYWDGLVLLVENRHPSKYVHFHFNCNVSQNALLSRKDSQRELFDVIPPNYRQIIVTISRKSPAHSFTIGHDFKYILSTQNYLKHGEGVRQRHWPKIDESEFSNDIHLPQSVSLATQI